MYINVHKNGVKKMGTESLLNYHSFIEELDENEALDLIIDNQYGSYKALKNAMPQIILSINQIYNRLKKNSSGRIIYVGSGSSGRIGVQDGVELFPTFGWEKDRLDFVIAGGTKALTDSVEGAEDNKIEAKSQVEIKNITNNDVIIGIAASGMTPFTVAFIDEARLRGALTIGISNNLNTLIQKASDISITLDTGAEVISGSTRLKAGTAQKICLNAISTLLMIKFQKVKNGQMIYMKDSNNKLILRRKRINSLLNK
jgi:N-acetylmuramic acid 6-phosphate etherase